MQDKPIRRQYAIAGMGMDVAIRADHAARSVEAEVVRQAVLDAGLKLQDIDCAIHLDEHPGGGRPRQWTDAYPRMLGMPVNAYLTMSRGGVAAAVMTGIAFLHAGLARYVVISRVCKDKSRGSENKKAGHMGRVHSQEPEGYWGKPMGDLRAVSHHTFFATRHMHEYGTTSEQLGAIAVGTRQWAHGNPLAQMRGRPMTIADHQNSPILVAPYHMFDICVMSDGAVAFILTTADRARALRKPPVYVMGIGTGEATSQLWWDKQNYTTLPVKTAKEMAFREAGITVADLDFAQLYDCFTMEVLMQLEDYGFCAKGEGGPYAATGHLAPGGRVGFNTGGGLLSAYHLGDMTPISEALIQLWQEGGDRQVPGARLGICTGHGSEILAPGLCSRHATVVLGRD